MITKEDIQKCITHRETNDIIDINSFNWCSVTLVLTLSNSKDYYIKIPNDFIKYIKKRHSLIIGNITIITDHGSDIECGDYFNIICSHNSKIKVGWFCNIEAQPYSDITVDQFCKVKTNNCSSIKTISNNNTINVNGKKHKLNKSDVLQLFPTDSTLSIAPKFDGYLLNGKHNGKDYVIERNNDYKMELKEIAYERI